MATREQLKQRRINAAIDVEAGMSIQSVMDKYEVSRPFVSRSVSEYEQETGTKITRTRAVRKLKQQKFESGYLTVVWYMSVPATMFHHRVDGQERSGLLHWSENLQSLRDTCKALGVKVTAQMFGGFHSKDYKSDFNPEPYLSLRRRIDSEAL